MVQISRSVLYLFMNAYITVIILYILVIISLHVFFFIQITDSVFDSDGDESSENGSIPTTLEKKQGKKFVRKNYTTLALQI